MKKSTLLSVFNFLVGFSLRFRNKKNQYSRSWRDGSEIKIIGCFCKVPEVNFQHQGTMMPSFDLCEHQAHGTQKYT